MGKASAEAVARIDVAFRVWLSRTLSGQVRRGADPHSSPGPSPLARRPRQDDPGGVSGVVVGAASLAGRTGWRVDGRRWGGRHVFPG